MADFNSSQPVRTENNGDVVVFLADPTVSTQKATVDANGSLSFLLKNASGTAATFTSTSLNVNVTNTVPVTSATDILPATQNITAQDIATTSTVSGNQTFYTGAPTANSAASFTLSSNETVMVETTGTWTGTLQAETSVDGGTTWVARSLHLIGSPTFLSNFTTNIIGSGNVAAKTNFRIRSTAAWTGTATIKIVQSANASTIYVANAIKLVDGSTPLSTVQANIVAASTAANATNTAIVVGLSPNSPLPAGSAVIGAVTQSGGPWTTKDNSDGPVTPGTVAANSMLIGGQFNTSLPVLTNTQQSAIQVDSSGRILIGALSAGAAVIGAVTQSAGPWTQNLTQVAGSAIALGQTTMSASLPVTFASNQSVLSTTDAADGSVGAGTAGTKSMLAGAVFNTSLPTLTNGQQAAVQADSSGRILVGSIASALPAGTNLLGSVNLDIGSAAVSPTNPIPVYIQDGGTSVNNYSTSASLAAAATSNHDYAVTAAKTLHLSQVHAAASGKLKIEVQLETGSGTGVFNTLYVGFNSTSNPNIDYTFSAEAQQVTGAKVRIIRTNEDKASQDVYSTISGHEQ